MGMISHFLMVRSVTLLLDPGRWSVKFDAPLILEIHHLWPTL
jgi:hypothetical protein